jgi:hypothetical protein
MTVVSRERPPQQPAVVVFENGVLTICTHDSTWDDILQSLQSATGADIEIPPHAEELVNVQLGPAPVREVVRALLTGSQFDYILVGSTADPTALTKVLLLPKLIAERGSTPEISKTQPALRAGDQPQETANLPEFVYQGDSSQGSLSSIRDQQRMLQPFRQAVLGSLPQEHTPK